MSEPDSEEDVLNSALSLLKKHKIDFNHLPKARNDNLWEKLEEICIGINFNQLSALKNKVCLIEKDSSSLHSQPDVIIPLVEFHNSASNQSITSVNEQQGSIQRYSICTNQFVLRTVLKYYKLVNHMRDYAFEPCSFVADAYNTLKNYLEGNGSIIGFFKKTKNNKLMPEEGISGFLASKLMSSLQLFIVNVQLLRKCSWIHQAPVLRIVENGLNKFDKIDMICVVDISIKNASGVDESIQFPLAMIEYGKSSSSYTVQNKRGQVAQNANVLFHQADWNERYHFASPLLAITIVDMDSIELRLFNLIKEKTPLGKAAAKVVDNLIYSGAIYSEQHFQCIIRFIHEWVEMMANSMVARHFTLDGGDHSLTYLPNSNVCIVSDVSLSSISPCPNFVNTKFDFGQKLSDSSYVQRVYKCFDYRESDKSLNARRTHKYYSDYVQDYEEVVCETGEKSDDLVIISYRYIEGVHVPTYVSQLFAVLLAVCDMHKSDLCHGDIRLRNCVFTHVAETELEQQTEDVPTTPRKMINPVCKFADKDAKLIDYDLSGKASERCYPPGYVLTIADGQRHPGAKAENLLEKEHDLFAVAAMWNLFVLDELLEDRVNEWNEVTTYMSSNLHSKSEDYYKEVQNKLKNIINCKVKLTDERLLTSLVSNQLTAGTGSPPTNKNRGLRNQLKSHNEHAGEEG